VILPCLNLFWPRIAQINTDFLFASQIDIATEALDTWKRKIRIFSVHRRFCGKPKSATGRINKEIRVNLCNL
jgi:hypothetical protein